MQIGQTCFSYAHTWSYGVGLVLPIAQKSVRIGERNLGRHKLRVSFEVKSECIVGTQVRKLL